MLLLHSRSAPARKPPVSQQLTLHLVDFVIDGGVPELQREALELKSDLLAARAAIEPSFIARNIFRNGATAAAEQAKAR
jgi:hypothetical protein